MGIVWIGKKKPKKENLSNNKNTPDALQVLTSKESLALFKAMNVMSEVEVKARQEVELEAYIMHVQIEGRVYNELVYSYIIPSAIEYQNKLIKNVTGLKEIYGAAYKKFAEGQLTIIEEIAEHIVELKKMTDAMTDAKSERPISLPIAKKKPMPIVKM